MKKILIYRATQELCDLRRKELGLPLADCILVSFNMSASKKQEKIKGYWNDVMRDNAIILDELTKEHFQILYS